MTTAPETVLLGGRYELGPLLGRGGMADVHLATDTVLGRDVAAKVFKPHVEDVDRTSSEVRLLASLNHPGLVSLYDAGTADGGSPWLVMELIDGPTLAACCVDGSLGPDRVATFGADLAEALAHCHERGVVHRDVKPANILITSSDRAKLTDFGIARLVDAARHTATGLTVGTAPYFSPEQVRGTEVGPPSDVYSLGLVLLECLTGRREYAEQNAVACAVARLHRSPDVPPSLPAPWPELLTAMTADEPAERPTAAEVATILRGSIPTMTLVASDDPATSVDHPASVDQTSVLDPYPAAAGEGIPSDAAAPPASTGEHPGLPEWVGSARQHLAGDPAGKIMAVALIICLLAVAAIAAFSATGGGGGAEGTPLERLERSVEK